MNICSLGGLPAGGGEVVPLLEVVEQADVGGLPAEPLAGDSTAGRYVEAENPTDPTEVVYCGLGGDAGDGHIQVAADSLSRPRPSSKDAGTDRGCGNR